MLRHFPLIPLNQQKTFNPSVMCEIILPYERFVVSVFFMDLILKWNSFSETWRRYRLTETSEDLCEVLTESAPLPVFIRPTWGGGRGGQLGSDWPWGDTWAAAYRGLVPEQVGDPQSGLCPGLGGLDVWPWGRPALIWSSKGLDHWSPAGWGPIEGHCEGQVHVWGEGEYTCLCQMSCFAQGGGWKTDSPAELDSFRDRNQTSKRKSDFREHANTWFWLVKTK